MSCSNCGQESIITFGNSCPKCEVPKTKFGELGQYCKDNMHLHCHSEFDYDCNCGCHEYFNNGVGLSLRKPMTEEYFFMMLLNLRWIH